MTLRKREKALILAVGLLILTGACYLLLVSPALSHQERLARSLEELEQDLQTMEGLRAEWLAFVSAREHAEALLENRGGGFSLLSFMESITRKVGVGDRIAYMKPLSFSDQEEGGQKAVGIEIQLDGLQMQDLVRLLHETEYSGKLLRVRRIKIRANSEKEQRDLKVTLQVETFIQGA